MADVKYNENEDENQESLLYETFNSGNIDDVLIS